MSSEQKPPILGRFDIVEFLAPFAKAFGFTFREIYRSFKNGTLPWADCLCVGALIGWSIYFRFDYILAKYFHLGFLYPESPTLFRFYWVFAVSLGFLGHGFMGYLKKQKIALELHSVFLEAGLQNRLGKFPQVLGKWELEEHVFKLKLTKANFPLSKFQGASDTLATRLGFIDTISEDRLAETVDIYYSRIEMPNIIPFVEKQTPGTLIVGRTRTKTIRLDFTEVPHLLIGGESTGGKTTFLRQLAAAIYLNDSHAKILFIDMKDGSEGQVFEGLPRVEVHFEPEAAAHSIDRVTPIIKERMELFRANEVPDRPSYLKIPEKDRIGTKLINAKDPIGRYFVIVDEAQLLFNMGPRLSSQLAQKARAAANVLTQQGRAVGIHVIIATQRPDVKAVDSHTKTNLGGQLCFAMNNPQSSISVINSGRACEIPKDKKGRAFWKYGSELLEIQTPYLTFDEAKAIFKELRAKKNSTEVVSIPSVRIEDEDLSGSGLKS